VLGQLLGADKPNRCQVATMILFETRGPWGAVFVISPVASPRQSDFSVSENGVMVYLSAASDNRQLAWYTRDGVRLADSPRGPDNS